MYFLSLNSPDSFSVKEKSYQHISQNFSFSVLWRKVRNDMRVSKQNVNSWVKAVFSRISQQARHLSFAVTFSLLTALSSGKCPIYSSMCLLMPHAYAISENACWPWLGCHGNRGTRLDGSVCGCVWDDCGVRSTAQAIQPSSSRGVSTNIPVGVDSCCWCLRGSNGI